MKAKYILLVIALASVFGACKREEKDLFDESAAVRAKKALDNAVDILTSQAGGWEMIYFANPTSAGYNVLVTFNENGSVTATAKNNATTGNAIQTDSSSTWGVINDYGPILTFDTYNKVLHAWADPQDDGDGLLGDYEFLILHAEPNYIKLKGKKHSAYCYLFPLGVGVTASEYFSAIEALGTRLFNNSNIFHAKSSDQEYLLYGGDAGIFIRTATGSTPNIETDPTFPVAVRRNGIQLMTPVLDNGGTKFDIQGDVMTDGKDKIFAAPISDYFTEYMKLAQGAWKIDIKDVNETTKAMIAQVDDSLKAKYPGNKKKASVQGLRYKQYEDKMAVVLSYIGNSSRANDIVFTYNIAQENGHINVAYVGPANETAQNVINAFPIMVDLLKTLDGKFNISTKDVFNPTSGANLVGQTNSSIWFNTTGTIE